MKPGSARTLLFSWLVVSLAAGGLGCQTEAGPAAGLHQPIVGGQPDIENPGVVGVFDRQQGFFCSAVLIDPRILITASGCVSSSAAENLVALFGDNAAQPHLELGVDSVVFRPEVYGRGPALLTLSGPVPVEIAQPIPLPAGVHQPLVGRTAKLVGYGIADDGSFGLRRSVELPVAAETDRWLTFQNQQSNVNQGACYGDAGGAALFDDGSGRFVLHGFIADNDFDCTKRTAVAKLDEHLDWIAGHIAIGNAFPDDRGDAAAPASDIVGVGPTYRDLTGAGRSTHLEVKLMLAAPPTPGFYGVGLEDRSGGQVWVHAHVPRPRRSAAAKFTGLPRIQGAIDGHVITFYVPLGPLLRRLDRESEDLLITAVASTASGGDRAPDVGAYRFAGFAPRIIIGQPEVSFGAVPLAGKATRTIRLTNPGLLPVANLRAHTFGKSFALAGGLPPSIAPGQTVTLDVTCRPTQLGVARGALVLRGLGKVSAQVPLVCKGTDPAPAVFADRMGDPLPEGGGELDLLATRYRIGEESVEINLEFDREVALPELDVNGGFVVPPPGSTIIYSLIEFDQDRSPGTGWCVGCSFFGVSSADGYAIGSEAYISLREVVEGKTPLWDENGNVITDVSVEANGRSLAVRIPRYVLRSDSCLDLGVITSDYFSPYNLDWQPDPANLRLAVDAGCVAPRPEPCEGAPVGEPCGLGACAGTVTCSAEGMLGCSGDDNLREEVPGEGVDNDCDGLVDETIPRVIYLNRGGATVYGATYNDASRNLTHLLAPGESATLPPASLNDSDWNAVVQCVQNQFAPFNVGVTVEKPGDDVWHIETVVGGVPGDLNPSFEQEDILGIASVPSSLEGFCGQASANTMSFAFSDIWYPLELGELCDTITHEIGHNLGLEHVFNPYDQMTYLPGAAKSFVDQDAPCGEYEERSCACGGETQNSFAILSDASKNLGPAPPCSPGTTRTCGAHIEGACELGHQTCSAEGVWGECIGAVWPVDELCGNLIDDDCDGRVDEGCNTPPLPF